MKKNNIFDLYLEKVMQLPLWVKQVLFVKLKEDMSEKNCIEFMEKSSNQMFSLYVPILTFEGKTELVEKKSGLDANFYNFLRLCDSDYSVLEIALNMYLTMEEVAKYFMFCVEQKYLEVPKSDEIYAMAGFIAGKLKTGEYLCGNKTLTFNQVQEAVEKQQELNVNNEQNLKFVEVLETLDFVKEKDMKVIFMLQEESKKRFILDYSNVPRAQRMFASTQEKSSAEIEELKEENKKLRQKLSQLLQLVKNK